MPIPIHVLSFAASLCVPLLAGAGGPARVVILKLDDFGYKAAQTSTHGVNPGWVPTLEYLDGKGIPIGIGIIAEHSDSASEDHLRYVKSLVASGHEIWHHGWDHDKAGSDGEFCGHPFEYQKTHFDDAMNLVKSKYGITMRSFGAPFNCSDSVFARVFENQTTVKVFMYPGSPRPKTGFFLERTADMEVATGKPDYAAFRTSYAKFPGQPVYTLQGHPAAWVAGSQELSEFKKIVEFLESENAVFMTPYQYYQFRTTSTRISEAPPRGPGSKFADARGWVRSAEGQPLIYCASCAGLMKSATPSGTVSFFGLTGRAYRPPF